MKRGVALFIIVLALATWASVLVFWILFWVDRDQRLHAYAAYASQLHPDLIGQESSVLSLVMGIVLLGLLLIGVNLLIIWVTRQYSMNKMTKDFVSMVSHDLRSPLTTIRLYLETMQMRRLEEAQQQRFLAVMLSETGKLAALIETIMDVSRMERNKYPLRMERMNLAEFTARFCEENKSRVESRNHLLKVGDLPEATIYGDGDALGKCLDNLNANAINYSEEGTGIHVDLSLDHRHAYL
ncbi:hypothetical protein JW905_13720, partial [bacterium]|nr:hypothetical protein [candidate division CSSED10-310 bacterium]